MANTQHIRDPLEEVRKRRLIIDRLDAWLMEEIRPYVGCRVLEVGCGHGNWIQHFLDREVVAALDKDPGSVTLVQARFKGHSNFRAYTHDICDPATEDLHQLRPDTVVSLNVLEHIEDDVRALRNMTTLLTEGGTLVLVVPAHQRLYGTMDRSIGHVRRYCKADLATKLSLVGLSVERQWYVNVLGVLGWWINGHILRQVVPPTGQLRWFNSLVPLLAWAERRVRPPFGLSLISVARRCKV
jgi:SAM-dependent methyltransferase